MRRLTLLSLVILGALFWLYGCDQTSHPLDSGITQATEQSEPLGQTVLVAQQAAMEAAVLAQESQTTRLMAISGVVGTGVGLGANGEPVVKVLVKSEAVSGLPSAINGIRVESLVTGEFFALQEAKVSQQVPVEPRKGKPTCGKKNLPPCPPPGPGLNERHPRPVPIGVSTGHPAITAGTLGARVTDGSDVWALSNNHVYADENQASIADYLIQPGTVDGGSRPADDVGILDDFEPIVFGDACVNVIDAAIGATTTALVGNTTPAGVGYGTPRSTTIAPAVNMKVKKVGRTTGFTKGTIAAINATVIVGYDTGTACFVGQIIITPGSFSAGGDSGSLIVVDGKGRTKNDDRKPVGLLYAGSSSSTVANPIGPVLTRFGVTIDGN